MKMVFDKLMNEKRFHAIIQMNSVLIWVVSILLILLCLSVTVSVILSYANLAKKSRYFATTSDGRLYALQPLSEPVLSQQAISSWGARLIEHTFSFNYLNVEEALTLVRASYTDKAFDSLLKNLNETGGLIPDVKHHKYIVSATLLSAPRLKSQGVNPETGRFEWAFIYPMLLTFKNESSTLSARFNIDTTMVRVDQRNNPFGVAVDKVIAKESRLNE